MTTQKSMRNMQLTLTKKNNQTQPDKKTIICLQPSDPYLYNIYIKMLGILKSDSPFCHEL